MLRALGLVIAAASLQGVLSAGMSLRNPVHKGSLAARDTNTTSEFPVYTFTQPLDHFSNESTATFEQRYWVTTRHYTPGSGGPVFILDGGETSGEDRIPYLDTGIVDILCKATGGLGLVLEHRYYGESIPVANFSTDNLRWLNNAQALEDSAYFMSHVNFTGIDEDLTAPNTPWIYYGGSYAGARAAHMKVLYPEIVFGSIASSGVVHADNNMWEYMDVIRTYAEPNCSKHLVNFATTIDEILESPLRKALRSLFGLNGLSHDYDFVNTIESTLGSWQDKNWDPAVSDTIFDDYCTALVQPVTNVSSLVDYSLVTEKEVKQLQAFPGFDNATFNYAKYVRENIVSQCTGNSTIEECFGSFDDSKYQDVGIDQSGRLWMFQVCTQWGYFTVAPPNHKQPRITSRLHTLEAESHTCHLLYPPGEYYSIPKLPNVTAVNDLGSFSIAADRLAIIDGEDDPWRPMTAHSQYFAKNRTDTTLRPYKLIPGAVHHWDENGLQNSTAEPAEIQKIHSEIVEFVREWLKDHNSTSSG